MARQGLYLCCWNKSSLHSPSRFNLSAYISSSQYCSCFKSHSFTLLTKMLFNSKWLTCSCNNMSCTSLLFCWQTLKSCWMRVQTSWSSLENKVDSFSKKNNRKVNSSSNSCCSTFKYISKVLVSNLFKKSTCCCQSPPSLFCSLVSNSLAQCTDCCCCMSSISS